MSTAPNIPAEWHYDDTGYYAYVLVNGDTDTLENVKTALSNRGIDCIRAGKSFHPANNGCQYDWFIRVLLRNGETPTKPTREDISTVFATPPQFPSPPLAGYLASPLMREDSSLALRAPQLYSSAEPAEPTGSSNLEGELENARAEISELEISLALRTRALETLRANWLQLRTIYGSEVTAKRAAEESVLQVAREFDAFKAKTESSTAEIEATASLELQEYQKRLEQERAEKDAVMAWWQEASGKLDVVANERETANAERDRAKEERDSLNAELDKLRREYHSSVCAQHKSTQRTDEMKKFIQILLPNIRLLRGSTDFLAKEVIDPFDAISLLYQIHSCPASLKSERVQDANGWLEARHISTGEDDQGRIYFRKMENLRYEVLVSHKEDQKRDIDWLKRQ
jgi:hypothetical protein